MIFGLIVLICALAISSIAAWYSIIGLIAIFAASPLPIALMGASLEAGKLVVLGVIAFVSVFVYLHALGALGI